jgi:hypothetical protein
MAIGNVKEKHKRTRNDELILKNYKGCCRNDKVQREIIRRWWSNGKGQGKQETNEKKK